ARELKSIHLDAEGQFIKLLVHKNYVNRYNLYNQVGLVAVNVIADVPEIVPADPHDPDPIHKYISLDTCDPDPVSIYQLIHVTLIHKYISLDTCDPYPVSIYHMIHVTLIHKYISLDTCDPYPVSIYHMIHVTLIHKYMSLDTCGPYPVSIYHMIHVTLIHKSLEQEEPIPEEPVTAKTGDGPEPLKENDLRTAGMAVDVFGEHLVQCAFSKQWNFRQEAMEMLEQEMTSSSPDLTSDKEPRNVVRATVILLKKGIKEKVLTPHKYKKQEVTWKN
ncbi:predicted protein, partial [Nematostella vectensis]